MSANTTYNDDEEYMMLGEHCSLSDCHQRDFLPIKCDRCSQQFCKLHFSYDDHKCPFRDITITCPLCSKLLPFAEDSLKQSAQDPRWIDRIVDEHMRRECPVMKGEDHAPNSQVKWRQSNGIARKCERDKCNSKAIVKCKRCGGVYCVQHRIEGDHICVENAARPSILTAASNVINNALSSSTSAKPSSSSGKSNGARGFTSAEELKAKYGKKKKKNGNSGRLGTGRGGNDYRSVNSKLADLHRQRAAERDKKSISAEKPSPVFSSSTQGERVTKSNGPVSHTPFGQSMKQKLRVLESKFANKKHSAEGQSSIALEDRFYLDVYFPLKSNTLPLHMFFNRRWKVGKVLDRIAVQGKIVNANATESNPAKRLNLFNIQTREKVPTDHTLENSDVLLEQGDSVILEYGEELSEEVKQAIARAFAHPEKSTESGCTLA